MATIKSIVRTDKATGKVVSAQLPGLVQQAKAVQLPRTIGLGDLVARFAQPIAWAIDKVSERLLTKALKTELAKCPACSRRHRKLNMQCPNVLTCPFLGRLLRWLPEDAHKALLDAAAKYAQPAPIAEPRPPAPS